MRRAAILLGVLLVTAPASAKTPAPSGVYGNVRTVEETGDMLGMEARFFRRDGRPMVEFVWCEGWCNDVHVLPVARAGRGYAFRYSQQADAGLPLEYRFIARSVGTGLRIWGWQGAEPLDGGAPYTLRRLGRPRAIPFARANGAR